jgi:lysophospholipase L1-like esterase
MPPGINVASLLPIAGSAHAEVFRQLDQRTRYMALGDSLTAGYGATPATEGYVYRLYQSGAFGSVSNTIFSNAGVPGATSRHILDHQVPQAIEAFKPTVITITAGGNDLLSTLNGADPQAVLAQLANNLASILRLLRTALSQARIYISNLYTVPEIPGASTLVEYTNEKVIRPVATAFAVPIADLHSAFLGKQGLLHSIRHGVDQFEVHPTNSGHRAIADAFKAVIQQQVDVAFKMKGKDQGQACISE